MIFLDRLEAGRKLADRIALRDLREPVVVVTEAGCARVAWEIARRLRAPMEAVVAIEVDVPGCRAVPIGAVAGGSFFPDQAAISSERLPGDYVERLAGYDLRRQASQECALRQKETALDLAGRSVILVDDGWASPLGVQAAVKVLRSRGAREVVYAAPCCAMEMYRRIRGKVSFATLVPPGGDAPIVLGDRISSAPVASEAPDLIGRSRRFQGEGQAPSLMNRIPGSSAAFQASIVAGSHFGSQSATVERKLATKGS